MQRPPKKLWRKIGLQKNFLQGTSHSDESKNTHSQLEQSIVKSQYSLSRLPQQQEDSFLKNKSKDSSDGKCDINMIVLRKQVNSSCETPINDLNFSGFEQRQVLWQQHPIPQQRLYNETSQPYYSQHCHNPTNTYNNLHHMQQTCYKCHSSKLREEEMRIRLHSPEQRADVDVTLSVKGQYGSFSIKKIARLNTYSLPQLAERVSSLRQEHKVTKSALIQQIASIKHHFEQVIVVSLNDQLQQLTDEIEYLYQENQELMTKIEEKQIITKKHIEDLSQLTSRLKQIQLNKLTEGQQKQSELIKLRNQVNVLEERLEDYQEVETHRQTLTARLALLEKQLLTMQHNEAHLGDIAKQRALELSSKELKLQELQWEITQLYNKNQEIQNNLRTEYAQKIQTDTAKTTQTQLQAQQETQNRRKLEQQLTKISQVLCQVLRNGNSLPFIDSTMRKYNIEEDQHMSGIFSISRQFLMQSVSQKPIQHQQFSSPNSPRNQSSDTINESSKNLLRKTGYFGQVNKPTLGFRLDDMQKKYSTQIVEEEVEGDWKHVWGQEEEERVKFVLQKKNKQNNQNVMPGYGRYRKDKPSPYPFKSQHEEQQESYRLNDQRLHYPLQSQRQHPFHEQRQHYPLQSQRQPYPEQQSWSNSRHSRYQSDPYNRQYPAKLSSQISEDLHIVKSSFRSNESQGNDSFSTTKYNNFNVQKQLSGQNPNYSFNEYNNFNFQHSPDTDNEDRDSVMTYGKTERSRNYHGDVGQGRDRERFQGKDNNDRNQRQNIIEKIKERVKEKFRLSRGKKQPSMTEESQLSYTRDIQPAYRRDAQSTYQQPRTSYNTTHYEQSRKQESGISDFYQKHRNSPAVTFVEAKLAERRLSPHSASRSPSNTRSRSPSNSSVAGRGQRQGVVVAGKYLPPGTGYPTSGVNKTVGSTTARSGFTKSLIERPEFVAYSRKSTLINNNNNTNMPSYQAKAPTYSNTSNVGGNLYTKKY